MLIDKLPRFNDEAVQRYSAGLSGPPHYVWVEDALHRQLLEAVRH